MTHRWSTRNERHLETPTRSKPPRRWQALADRLGRDQLRTARPRARPRAALSLGNHQGAGREQVHRACSCRASSAARAKPFGHRRGGGDPRHALRSTAAIMCAYQLGAFPILLAGTQEQKNLYLREMTQGRATSFALSERIAGSDAAAIEATAVREGDGWRLQRREVLDRQRRRVAILRGVRQDRPGRRRARHQRLHGRQGAARRGHRRTVGQDGHPRHSDLEPEGRPGGARQRAHRRGQPRAAPGAADAQRRPHHGVGAIAGPGTRRIPRGLPPRGRAQDLRPPDHRQPGHRLHAGRHGHRDLGGAHGAVRSRARLRPSGGTCRTSARWPSSTPPR